MKFLILISAMFVPLIAFSSPLSCEQVLSLSHSESNSGIHSLFSRLNFGPKDGQPIVFYSTDHVFIGDHLIIAVSRIYRLHQLFPNSKIYFATFLSSMIQNTPWLQPLSLKLKPEEIFKTAGSNSFWISQNEMPAAFLQTAKLSGIILNDSSGFTRRESFRIYENGLLRSVLAPEVQMQYNDPYNENLYTMAEKNVEYFFGRGTGPLILPEIFLPPHSYEHVSQFLKTAFPATSKARFVIINLNTVGLWKVQAIEPLYKDFLEKLILEIHRTRPDVNILITEPEASFGKSASDSAQALVSKFSSFVQFMPEDKTDWQALIQLSEYVVTQDSGFMHLALVMKSEDDVFGLGTHLGILKSWCKPTQPCGGYDGKDLYRWLEKKSKNAAE